MFADTALNPCTHFQFSPQITKTWGGLRFCTLLFLCTAVWLLLSHLKLSLCFNSVTSKRGKYAKDTSKCYWASVYLSQSVWLIRKSKVPVSDTEVSKWAWACLRPSQCLGCSTISFLHRLDKVCNFGLSEMFRLFLYLRLTRTFFQTGAEARSLEPDCQTD